MRPAGDTGIEDADALILLGGSMSANDNLSFTQPRDRIHPSAADRGRKTGTGNLPGRAIDRESSGRQGLREREEGNRLGAGNLHAAARNDPLFHGHEAEVIFHWHGETFDLPDGAELLASSAACRHQAFRFGDRVYGLQFHLEVTPQVISQWCQEDEACGVREASGRIDPFAHAARVTTLARLVFGRWCELAKAQTTPRRGALSSS